MTDPLSKAHVPTMACVAVVKNEELRIAEWLTFQYALGFDAVVLLDNMSTDHTKSRAKEVAGSRRLDILDWPVTDPDYQRSGYEFAAVHLENQFDWLAFFDTDEFLVLEAGYDLKSLLAALPDTGAVAVCWAIFGSSGHMARPTGSVVDSFVYRSHASFGTNRHVKSIVRARAMRGCQGAHTFYAEGRYTDLVGRDIIWGNRGGEQADVNYQRGKLHHYLTRSREDWIAKLRRGYHDTHRKLDEFEIYDRNEVFDDSASCFYQNILKSGNW